jgi:hypothetical protein
MLSKLLLAAASKEAREEPMDRSSRVRTRPVRAAAVALLLAATAGAQSPREEPAVRKRDAIYLKSDERRLVDHRLVERIRCERGVLIVRPLGRYALVECGAAPPTVVR